MSIEQVESEAMKLSPRERARLASKLLNSLDANAAENNEELWTQESEQRYEALASGKVQGIDADTALQEARAKLKK
ncbi:MAG: addiction module protein [Rhizobacter sp.]|nr:addiction module protein [Chlorobiales bacterium]